MIAAVVVDGNSTSGLGHILRFNMRDVDGPVSFALWKYRDQIGVHTSCNRSATAGCVLRNHVNHLKFLQSTKKDLWIVVQLSELRPPNHIKLRLVESGHRSQFGTGKSCPGMENQTLYSQTAQALAVLICEETAYQLPTLSLYGLDAFERRVRPQAFRTP